MTSTQTSAVLKHEVTPANGSDLRILMVSNFLSVNGTSRGACEELADRLTQSGCQVITTSSRSSRLLRLFDMTSTVWRRRNDFDVAQVDVYSGSAFLWAEAVCLVLRRLKLPYVLALHGGGLPDFAERHSKRVKQLLSTASIVTTPSEFLRDAMSLYRKDMKLIPNSLNLEKYEFRLRTNPQPNLIWLRSLHRMYNPVLAIQVLDRVKKQYPNATLTMVGPDKGDGSLNDVKTEMANLGIADSVELRGVIGKEDVPRTLNEGDIFLNTTNVDNTPISVIEAMACGLCIVSTDVGGIPHLLTDQQDSLLVPPRNADTMADAVCRVLSEPKLSESLSAKAQQNAEKFDWSNTLPMWQSVLRQARSRE
ncbi:glycosyltransferase family 4 protein [Novipirellula sp. SH528]|uniref:glycosyltransferase family 4 protein n=1 Tax=Novipirellula sp. SH528 TaxID=3454466 RepID=UPI003FA0FE61